MNKELKEAIRLGKTILCRPWHEDSHEYAWSLYYIVDNERIISIYQVTYSKFRCRYTVVYQPYQVDDYFYSKHYTSIEDAQLDVQRRYNVRIISEEEYKKLATML